MINKLLKNKKAIAAVGLVVLILVMYNNNYIDFGFLEGMEMPNELPTAIVIDEEEEPIGPIQTKTAQANDVIGQDAEITTQDLLPKLSGSNDFGKQFDQVSALENKNFITSGHHIGINTVGSSLRNSNQSIRSEPINPIGPAPTSNSTILPDLFRRTLDVN